MMVRLKVIVNRFNKGKTRFNLSKRFKNFLNRRTKLSKKDRFNAIFKTGKTKKSKIAKKSKTVKKSKKNKKKNKGNNMDKRQYLLKKCGLPDIPETKHCFNDGTHHTCCGLGSDSRKYADETENPIGKLSETVFRKKNKRGVKKNELTSWCTCSGSEVCGFYNDKFSDGTKIKFVNNPNKDQIAENIQGKKCEAYIRDTMGVMPHGTPGIISKNGGVCEDKDIIKFSDIHY